MAPVQHRDACVTTFCPCRQERQLPLSTQGVQLAIQNLATQEPSSGTKSFQAS